MKLTKLSAGHYEHGNYFIYKDDTNAPCWFVYRWVDANRTESEYVTDTDSLWHAKELLKQEIAHRATP
jgi:hypothetical protein